MYFKLKFLIFCAVLLVLSSGDAFEDVPDDSLDDSELDEVIEKLEEKVSKLVEQSKSVGLEGQEEIEDDSQAHLMKRPNYIRNLRMADVMNRMNRRRQRRRPREHREKIIPNCKRWNLC